MEPIQYVTINDQPDYEIQTLYPHRIRRIGSTKDVTVNMSQTYPRVALNGKMYNLHRLIALQFIPNPNGLSCVDHINRDTNDYHLVNLRWVSTSENMRNRTGHIGVTYEILEYNELEDDDLTVVNHYNRHAIEDVYYDELNNRFIFDTGVNYRVLHIGFTKNGSAYVNCKSVEGKLLKVLFNVFKRMYGFQM